MDLRLDPASAVPLYAQVVQQVRSLIASRVLRAGDRLPSVRELAVSARINRNTAAKAYQALEGEGILENRHGQGCFVTGRGPRWTREERLRRMERSVDQLLVEASHLEFPFEDLEALLRRRAAQFGWRPPQPAGKD